MTRQQAVALSLAPQLSRVGLTARLQADDPELLEAARANAGRAAAVERSAVERGVHALAWNDAGFPRWLLAIADCPPVLWYRGSIDLFDVPAVAIVGSRAATA